MKVKDFIKILKEQDPDSYIRILGGAILYAEPKDGYWDGPYEYRDGDKFLISTRGSKVDIHTQDVEDFIWDNDGDYSKVKLDLAGYSGETLKHQVKEYQERFKKTSEECKKFQQQSLEHHAFQVVKKLQEGWRVQETKKDGKWLKSTMDFVKYSFLNKRMCIGDCQAIYKSGLFKSYGEDDKFRLWRLKE